MYRDYTNIPVDLINETLAKRVIQFIQNIIPNCYIPDNTFFVRRRIALALIGLKLTTEDIENGINNKNNELADQLLSFICTDHTELFRDTDVWIILRDTILKKMSLEKKTSICISNTIYGEELFSMLILLNEYYSLNDFSVTVSGFSEWALKKISDGIMCQPKIRSSLLNLKQVCGNAEINKYTVKVNNNIRFNKEFLSRLIFVNEQYSEKIRKYDLILCRNKTLNMNQSASNNFHQQLQEKINPKGFLLLGTAECVDKKSFEQFRAVSWEEKIFQKEK